MGDKNKKKTLQVVIEVEVHDWATHVAVDNGGIPYEYGCKPRPNLRSLEWDITDEYVSYGRCTVVNWMDTSIRVEQDGFQNGIFEIPADMRRRSMVAIQKVFGCLLKGLVEAAKRGKKND